MKRNTIALRETIYNQIMNDIINRRIYPGAKLLQSEIAKRFEVSRTPVREALLQLEKEGYVTHIKDVGAIVKEVSVKKFIETYELIALLEGYSTEKAIDGKIKRLQIAHLEKLQKEMEKHAKNRNYREYLERNSQFHEFFTKKSENESLQEMAEELRKKLYRFIPEGLSLPPYIDNYLKSHRKIIDEVRANHAKKAGNIMKNHVLERGKNLLSLMKEGRWAESENL